MKEKKINHGAGSEAELLRHSARLSNAMKIARMGHWEYNVATDLFIFNDQFYAIYCTNAEREGGYTMPSCEYFRRFVHPDEIPLIADEIQKVIDITDPGYNRYFQHKFLNINGETGYMAVRLFIIKDDNGKTIQTYGVNQDITERVNAENALMESEKRYRMLFENSLEAMILTTPDGHIYSANPSACKMLGYSAPEICTLRREDLVDTLDPRFHYALHKQMNQGTFKGELNFVRKNGTIFPVEVFFTAFHGNEGSIFFHDITNRKLAEDKLTYQASLLSRIHDAVFATDEKKIITYWNKTAEDIFGWNEEEAIGRSALSLFQTENPNLTIGGQFEVPLEADHYEGEAVYTRKDGAQIIVHAKSTALRGSDGEFIGLVTSTRDITEKKRIEGALREERTLLRTIVDNLPIALYIKDKEAKKVLSNPMDLKYIGKQETEVLGKTDYDFYAKDIADKTSADDFNVLNTGEPVISREENIINSQGKSIWLYTSKIPRRNQSGEVVGIIGMGLDITERKKAEEELWRAKEKAEESDRLKTAFLSNMSHEIRTPMNAILGFSGIITQPGLPDSKKAHFSKLIRERANDLLRIIEDILDLSKLEIGQMTLTESYVNIRMLLEELYNYYVTKQENLKLGPNTLFSLQIDDSLQPPTILADEVRLKQILMSLIDNSFKFTPEGSITIHGSIHDGQLFITIADTGIGIPSEKQSIIFDSFRQVDEVPTTRLYGGTGIGLSIAKGLINLMGGTIWFESEVNKGSAFHLTIPIKQSETPLKKGSLNLYNNKSLMDKTILIVEDDEPSIELLNEMISSIQANTIAARNGNEAIEMFKNNPHIDLVLLDIGLPDKNGLQVARFMKELRPHVPIVAQTAYASSNESKDCFDAGCDGFISKPIHQDKLIEMVLAYLSKDVS